MSGRCPRCPTCYHHERFYRGADLLTRLGSTSVTLCGAGALGSLLADNLARQGVRRWKVIDRDRVEEHNAGTQLYGQSEVGAWKVEALRTRLFRAVGVEIEAVAKELNDRNAQEPAQGLRRHHRCVRQLGRAPARPGALPGGGRFLASTSGSTPTMPRSSGTRDYRVPNDVAGDVCDYPLARNLVLLAVAVASEAVSRYIQDGRQDGWSITLRDFAVRPFEAFSGSPSTGGRDRVTGSVRSSS